MERLIYLLLLMSLLSACGSSTDNALHDMAAVNEEMMPITRMSGPPMSPPLEPLPTDTVEKKVIKDGEVGLKVKNVYKAKVYIDTLVSQFGGYYASESLNNYDDEASWHLSIRIPSASFEKFVQVLSSGVGKMVDKEINTRDVTEQFIDLETRLANKRSYLKRYNELLQKARNVQDIIEIEEKIRKIEEEIESTVGRLNYLSNQVQYSSLELRLFTDNEGVIKTRDRNVLLIVKQSLVSGWYGFVDFLFFLLRIWPLLIFAPLLVYLYRKIRRKKRLGRSSRKL
ncbi:MAG: DUF4349 domain-containing protein [Bacteroidota bacterium]